MATKKRARITLVGPLSYSVGRYRFQKGKPLVTEDQELIAYLHGDPNFSIETLAVEEEAKAKASAPVEKPAAKPEPKPEAKSKSKDEDEVEEVKAPVKAAPPSKLARKNEKQKKETAHETD